METWFRILGPLEVFDGSQWCTLGAAKWRALLAALITQPGQALSTDQITDELWGEHPPRTAVNQVHTYVMRLRQVLRQEGRLVTRPPGYLLAADRTEIDAGQFAELTVAADAALRSGDAAGAGRRYAAALAMWRGPAFAGVPPSPRVTAEAARLEELRLAAVEGRIDADLRCGRHGTLIGELRSLLDEHPLRERLWEYLMLAYYRCGRQADALAAFQQVYRLLDAELGVEPAPALRALHRQILAADPALDLPAGTARTVPDTAGLPPADGPAAPPVPRQLPTDVAGFVGRDRDIEVLESLVAAPHTTGVPVVNVTGTAGVGKTSLAVHFAHRVAARFPDGQLYINLRGYAAGTPVRPIDALARFLRALGVRPGDVSLDVEETAARYRSMLAGRRVLVLLDNAATAEQVLPLLPGSADCLVLVTSRDLLSGLLVRAAAHTVELSRLVPGDAVMLLRQAVGPRVEAQPAAVARLAEVCAHLPLALRIAAANLIGQPHQDIAGYVTELTGGDLLGRLTVDGDEQIGVPAAFDLSYQRLPALARTLFRWSGLVPGPTVTASAAGALLNCPPAAARREIGRLAAAHLIEPAGPDRFGLHDLLRSYAVERAGREDDEPTRQAAQARLLTWYLRTGDAAARLLYPRVVRLPVTAAFAAGPAPATFGDHAAALAWLDAERANLVAAVTAAADHHREAAWLLADTLRGYFRLRRHMMDWLTVATAGRSAADAAGDCGGTAAAHLSLADAHRELGQYTTAIEHYSTALAHARKAGWPEAEAATLGNLGTVYWSTGKLERAAEHYTRSLARHASVGHRIGEANTLVSLGGLYTEWGKLAPAAEYCRRALAIHQQTEDRGGEAIDTNNLGDVAYLRGELDTAQAHFIRALELYRQAGDRSGESLAQCGLAAVHCDAGRRAQAAPLADSALAIARDTRDHRATAIARTTRGTLCLRDGRPRDAVGEYEQARQLCHATGDRYLELDAILGLAAAHCADGTLATARRYAIHARDAAHETGYLVLDGRAREILADIHLASGQPVAAADLARQAVSLHHATGYRLGEARALAALSRALSRCDRQDEGMETLLRARVIFAELGVPRELVEDPDPPVAECRRAVPVRS